RPPIWTGAPGPSAGQSPGRAAGRAVCAPARSVAQPGRSCRRRWPWRSPRVYPIVIGKAAGKLRICGRDKATQLLLRNCDNQYMAKDEEEKKQEGEQPPPETILETEKQRDPDEATFAEQAIHAYAEEILQTFRESVENALDGFMAWVESNNDGKL